MTRVRDILCPYCFTRWRTNVAAFRCTNGDASRCPPVPDEALGRLRGIPAPLASPVLVKQARFGKPFSVKPGHPVRCKCGAATKPVCPSCHSDLPQRFAETASQSMALIGTKAAGKSHFIAVALHELEHKVGPRFGGSLMLLDDWSRTRVQHELLPRLYGTGVVLEPSSSARVNASDVRKPLVSRLTLGRADHAHSSNLVFFDAAGEDLRSLDVLEREARYITQSDGLILLVDPLQIAAVRDELDASVALPPITEDPTTMLGRVASLLREARAIPAKRQIEVPLGLAVSKVDALRPLLPDTHPVFALPPHNGHFDRSAARTISETLRSDLAGWIGERFDNLVRTEFATYAYFGVSALGESPIDGKLRNGVAPLRIEDPVLWMLDAWKALPR